MRRVVKSRSDSRDTRQPYYVECISTTEWERFFLEFRMQERLDICPVHPDRAEAFYTSPYRNVRTFEIEWEIDDGLERLRAHCRGGSLRGVT